MPYHSHLKTFLYTSPYAGVSLLGGTLALAFALAGAAHLVWPDPPEPTLGAAVALAPLPDAQLMSPAGGGVLLDRSQPTGARVKAMAPRATPGSAQVATSACETRAGSPCGHVLAARLAYKDGDSSPPLLYWVALWSSGSWDGSAWSCDGMAIPACSALSRSTLMDEVTQAFNAEAGALDENERPRSPEFKLPPALVQAVTSRIEADPRVEVVFLDTYH